MYIFLAIVIGLIINYFTGGFEFNSVLCILSGLFLIMPSLLKFNIGDFKLLKDNKKIVGINILINFLIIPLVFFSIGYLFFGIGTITYALTFLGLLPGGGMLFSWINKTGGNIKIGFPIFFLNILIFTILFFPINYYFKTIGDEYKQNITKTESTQLDFLKKLNNKKEPCGLHKLLGNNNNTNQVTPTEPCSLSKATGGVVDCGTSDTHFNPVGIIMFLIVFPFLISRVILLSPKVTNFIQPKIPYISTFATFFIVAYVFTLKQVNLIFSVSHMTLISILLALILAYLIYYTIVYFIVYKTKNIENNTRSPLFWNSATRFLTMGLIFSFIYSTTFGINFVLVFALSYFVQIFFSYVYYYIIKKQG